MTRNVIPLHRTRPVPRPHADTPIVIVAAGLILLAIVLMAAWAASGDGP